MSVIVAGRLVDKVRRTGAFTPPGAAEPITYDHFIYKILGADFDVTEVKVPADGAQLSLGDDVLARCLVRVNREGYRLQLVDWLDELPVINFSPSQVNER